MVNRSGLRLVGIDRDDFTEVEPPATYFFAEYVEQFRNRLPEHPVDPIRLALGALDDVSRRMEDLARDLNVFGRADDDTDRPRAA
ncbi:MAG: hypothetical protein SGJ09_14125 [Phycisphaerae bacterium]|nr:hypothetical protein [Phycisphaerae bacterium]